MHAPYLKASSWNNPCCTIFAELCLSCFSNLLLFILFMHCKTRSLVLCLPRSLVLCLPRSLVLCLPRSLVLCLPRSLVLCLPRSLVLCLPRSLVLCLPRSLVLCLPRSLVLCLSRCTQQFISYLYVHCTEELAGRCGLVYMYIHAHRINFVLPDPPSASGSAYPKSSYPTQQQPGYPTQQQPAYPTQQQPGYPPQQPGYPPQQPGYPPRQPYPGQPQQQGMQTSVSHARSLWWSGAHEFLLLFNCVAVLSSYIKERNLTP